MAENAYLKEYLESLEGREYSSATLRQRSDVLRAFFRFLEAEGPERIQDAAPETMERYRSTLTKRSLAAATIRIHLRSIKAFFRFLEKRGVVFADPTAGLRIPKRDRRLPDVPTEEEVRRLLAAPDVSSPLGVRDRAILETLYSTGVRRAELLGMTIRCPNLREGLVRVMGKGRKERTVPLGKHAVHWLERYFPEARNQLLGGRLDEDALWITRRGRPMSGSDLAHLTERHREAAGRPISAHALRRACATHLLDNGAHPVMVQNLLGHADLKTLAHYMRSSTAEIAAAHRRTRPGR